MNCEPNYWTETEDSFLRTAWSGGMLAAEIGKVIGRSEHGIVRRARRLRLQRRDMTDARRRAALAIAQEREPEAQPRPRPDHDETHWRACLAAGGFAASYEFRGGIVHVYPSQLEAAE